MRRRIGHKDDSSRTRSAPIISVFGNGKRDMDLFDFMTGRSLGRTQDYGDEVLNAGWLPQPEAALAGRRPQPVRQRSVVADPDAFLRDIYRAQE